jgi:Peptidase M16 inactive domain
VYCCHGGALHTVSVYVLTQNHAFSKAVESARMHTLSVRFADTSTHTSTCTLRTLSMLAYNMLHLQNTTTAASTATLLPLHCCCVVYTQALFPDNTYGVDSGGDPAAIPTLTFDYFKNFHRRFYHPANARIYFYGDDPVPKRLELLDEVSSNVYQCNAC